MSKVIFVGLLIGMRFCCCYAQQPEADAFLAKVAATYANAETFHITVALTATAADGTAAMPVQQHEVVRQEGMYYTETPLLISVVTANHHILIDKDQQTMRFRRLTDEDRAGLRTSGTQALHLPGAAAEAVAGFATVDGEVVVTLRENADFARTDYAFDRDTYLLNKITFIPVADGHGRPARITATYTHLAFNEAVSTDCFNPAAYIAGLDNDNPTPAAGFAGYTLIDSTPTAP